MNTNRFTTLPDAKLLKTKTALKTAFYLFGVSILIFLGTVVYTAQSTGFRLLSLLPVVIMVIPVWIYAYNFRQLKKEIKSRGLR